MALYGLLCHFMIFYGRILSFLAVIDPNAFGFVHSRLCFFTKIGYFFQTPSTKYWLNTWQIVSKKFSTKWMSGLSHNLPLTATKETHLQEVSKNQWLMTTFFIELTLTGLNPGPIGLIFHCSRPFYPPLRKILRQKKLVFQIMKE